jgi:hypothetical protein
MLFFETNVDNPYLVTFLMRTFVCEWYMVWCGSKNGYYKHMFLKEIELLAQNMITNLGSLSLYFVLP